ncbi:pyruvate, phosphate dikinase [Mycobacterium paraintracellulare]|uniref:Pyruvate, phosphate dikinase PpdK n=1 Tax=Mycobacterium paraintracellulare TaxID=1138383 RepID=A0ABM7K907_9MYCO|nr:pyruvate, phosphate dikinase [Mycobacterium paraintracellulare]AFC53194.1 pyruvate phosphate dikinase [Mycobacterium paraintracellulare]OSC23312.1 pyruvate, phosphate dikinase [Mycobacterium paraintracellulare]BBY71360.1 pyruvate, phosphate dikinase PpdK [Mycobacterium paraintracellulare]
MTPPAETATSRVQFLVEGGELTREEVGGKAWSVQHMLSLGIPVPPAFVLTTAVCREYHHGGRVLPPGVLDEVRAAMEELERRTGRRFASAERPLLVSVRSGAATSMPGMMDTILNLGMTLAIEHALAAETGDAEYAADTRRRFDEQFDKVVGVRPPESPWQQLELAIRAVLDSWHSKRAKAYRQTRGISDDGGTAVTIQAMVFGNLDNRSGTGVLFTRDPLSGNPEPYGEWLTRGQGEDVVSGRADAQHLDDLLAAMPSVHRDLLAAASVLERHGRDVQDIEFTVQSGTLWLLQSRSAKRTPQAALRCVVQLEREGVITSGEALDRVTEDQVRALQRPVLDPASIAAAPPVASGKPASPGIATGVVVIDADEAERLADDGQSVILARPTTDPDDVAAMSASVAVLTELGGSTSHAAVVCREMAIPCVVGCGIDTVTALAGNVVTVDADTGTVHAGALPVRPAVATDDSDMRTLEGWLREEVADRDPAADVITLMRRRRERTETR